MLINNNAATWTRVVAPYRNFAAGLLIAGVILTSVARAQEAERQARISVMVVLVDSLPVSGTGAIIQRRAQIAPHDVILLTPRSATARQLSAAVFTLLTVHAITGNEPAENAFVSVNSREGPYAWIETEERRAEGIVRQLRRKTPAYVPGYGFVRSVRLTVPAQAFSQRLRKRQ